MCTAKKKDDVLIFCSNHHIVDTMANIMVQPQRLLGVCFVHPVILMPHVDLKPSARTDPDTVSRAFRWLESVGKTVKIAPSKPSYFTKAEAYQKQKKSSFEKYGGFIGIASQRIVSHCFDALALYPSVWDALHVLVAPSPRVLVEEEAATEAEGGGGGGGGGGGSGGSSSRVMMSDFGHTEHGTIGGDKTGLMFNLRDTNERDLPQCVVADEANPNPNP